MGSLAKGEYRSSSNFEEVMPSNMSGILCSGHAIITHLINASEMRFVLYVFLVRLLRRPHLVTEVQFANECHPDASSLMDLCSQRDVGGFGTQKEVQKGNVMGAWHFVNHES